MTYPQLIALAIGDLESLPQASGVAATFSGDLEDLLKSLSSTKEGRKASSIITVARSLGATDTTAVSLAVIAAAESGLDPTARNASSGAIGYFQMIPRYWKSAAATTTSAILRAQISEILTDRSNIYDFGATDDPFSLYASHMLPGLGRIYRQTGTLGVQAGNSTYGGQYAFKDDRGSVFHSPALMFLYSRRKFETVTGTLPEFSVPAMPRAVSSGSLSGRKIYSTFEISGTIAISTSGVYVKGTGAAALNITRHDTSVRRTPFNIGDETPISGSDIKYSVDDLGSAVRVDFGNGLFQVFDLENVKFEATAEYATNVFTPSLDTAVVAIRKKFADTSVLDRLLVIQALTSSAMKLFTPKSGGGPGVLTPTPALEKLKNFDSADSTRDAFANLYASLSDDDLASLLTFCLSSYLQTCSPDILQRQLSLHVPVVFHGDISPTEFGTDLNVEQYRFDFPWLLYNGVMFPFSLLTCPDRHETIENGSLAIPSRTFARLASWAKSMAAGDLSTDTFFQVVKKMLQ